MHVLWITFSVKNSMTSGSDILKIIILGMKTAPIEKSMILAIYV